MGKVIVTIPVYKKNLSAEERISLRQVRKILGLYPIAFFAPVDLDFDYGEECTDSVIERFDSCFFTGRTGYSRLMLSKEFYERFSDFEYMLIYQLDAFVFHDELGHFCGMGYDYVGAPIPRSLLLWQGLGARIGNGGFSLRRTAKMIEMLEQKQQIIGRHPKAREITANEDMFWALCSTKPELDFHVPDVKTALVFSMEEEVGNCYRRWSGCLPFGCHAWGRINYSFWKPIIEGYGYGLEERADEINTGEVRHERIRRYLWSRTCWLENQEGLQSVFEGFWDDSVSYAIWGGGMYGQFLLHLMKKTRAKISCVYDKKASGDGDLQGLPAVLPSREALRRNNDIVIVATPKYESEIVGKLEAWGLSEGREFVRLSQVEKDLWEWYKDRIGFGTNNEGKSNNNDTYLQKRAFL